MGPEIKFIGKEFDGTEKDLGDLSGKFIDLANEQAVEHYGDAALRDPSDIEVLPAVQDDEPFLAVKAWHQTCSDRHPGVIQNHDFVMDMTRRGEDAYLTVRESGHERILTTRETLVLMTIANIAVAKTVPSNLD